MQEFKDFAEIKLIDEQFKNEFASTFNLWEGNKNKSNILKYKKDYNGYHPTQKPILLLEDLIKTCSNENDLVVDLTMGSGSTGVAALRTGRRFVDFNIRVLPKRLHITLHWQNSRFSAVIGLLFFYHHLCFIENL